MTSLFLWRTNLRLPNVCGFKKAKNLKKPQVYVLRFFLEKPKTQVKSLNSSFFFILKVIIL